MSDIVIKAEGLGKKYLIGHQSERERYTALRDVMARNVKGVWNKTRQVLSGQQLLAGDEIEEFWALRDIDFEIKRGDRVGIIGRNGAGKSTLLKVLSRITEPSEGKVTIKGRVASLLEVGTGFHPELTGRENIYLNGAILGMTRNEIKKKFDEIVDFAGVEKFLDTPVKRYSSGMYVRLAFAVAAHLEPEILVVDEVLAVGDAEFQKKCLGKMEDVSRNEGRTVLFVSHQLPMILNLCQTCIQLRDGEIINFGKPTEVISKYLTESKSTSKYISNISDNKKSHPYYELISIYYETSNLQYSGLIVFEAKQDVKLIITYELRILIEDDKLNFGFILKDEMGNVLILSMNTDMPESKWLKLTKKIHYLNAIIDTSILNEGKYYIYLISSIHGVKMIHKVEDDIMISFEIVGNRGDSPYWVGKKQSILAPYIEWNNEK